MKKLVIIALIGIATLVGACGNSTSADFDRWEFYQEMYGDCVSACEVCAKFSDCPGTLRDMQACVDRLWLKGTPAETCISVSRILGEIHTEDQCISQDASQYSMCYNTD